MALHTQENTTKRSIPVDLSSKILYKVDAATVDAVTASVVHGWIGELDESIQATKVGSLRKSPGLT
jgi:centromere/kinetochore protein ZW10